ncbi:hypothetical protein CANARDRAFT_8936 [[Candida] arabinofermentans NRRL YB-2248]|uniref:Uncharacterized protein n=1 Tax=[Candida] arabinofermentans NRRL YB-2248 TaxID=983967 RepID=A0A1E4SXN9_9ASCO|nr:hypothetical protein CANARDRAFT_8936 [[Candida] arabinofermentans NRRL YB-2248]
MSTSATSPMANKNAPLPPSPAHSSQTPVLPQSPQVQQPQRHIQHDDATVPTQELFTKEVNAIALDYLINECIPLSVRVEEMLLEGQSEISAAISELKLETAEGEEGIDNETQRKDKFEPGTVTFLNDESKFLHLNNLYRIENYGYEIGLKITDCLIYMKNSNPNEATVNMRLVEVLEIMKFICRDVWKIIYLKQMDNLRTNHIGTFVLIDNNFRPLTNFYSSLGEEDTLRKVQPYLQFPCGLIKGILTSLGIESIVKAEVMNGKLPSVSFNVQTNFNNGGMSKMM